MERNEFIKSLGLGVAMVCTGACFSACGKKVIHRNPANPTVVEYLQVPQPV